MNQRGGVFDNILLFCGILLLLGLYVNALEPSILSTIANSPTSGTGTDNYIIIASASILFLLYAIFQLTKQPDSLSFGA